MERKTKFTSPPRGTLLEPSIKDGVCSKHITRSIRYLTTWFPAISTMFSIRVMCRHNGD